MSLCGDLEYVIVIYLLEYFLTGVFSSFSICSESFPLTGGDFAELLFLLIGDYEFEWYFSFGDDLWLCCGDSDILAVFDFAPVGFGDFWYLITYLFEAKFEWWCLSFCGDLLWLDAFTFLAIFVLVGVGDSYFSICYFCFVFGESSVCLIFLDGLFGRLDLYSGAPISRFDGLLLLVIRTIL